ncbi:MAG: GNAT family N-acetyltransferase [Nitrospirota bacterium]
MFSVNHGPAHGPSSGLNTVEKSGAKTVAAIRRMTRADLDRVGDILFDAFNGGAARYGYPPRMHDRREGTSWAWSLLRHGPGDVLLAEVDGRAAGVCCLNPRGLHGGIGPVAVDPSFQGHGIGRLLLNAVLERAAGLRSVRLFQETFNPASLALYSSVGFAPVAELLDVTRAPGARAAGPPSGDVSELAADDLDAVQAYDTPRSRFDRRSDLALFRQWGRIFVTRDQSGIRGFLACLPAAQSVQLGPLVADGEEEATRLFQRAAAVYGDRPCQTRVMARDTSLVTALEGMGFELYCRNNLMVRGDWRPSRSIEAFGRFPEGA